MKLILAGGCGEHGRNCFLVEGETDNLMVDCGTMAGDEYPMPHLTREQILHTRYVFLTHSHKDHTGAAVWLIEQGFCGTFVMTAETARQLPFVLPNVILLPVPEKKPEVIHLDDIKVTYGMSGHCAGAVWYRIVWEDHKLFFSGDYNFYSDVYEHQAIIGKRADAAVIDSCYPADAWDQESFIAALRTAIVSSSHVLLPVPKYGRGLDILLLLIRYFPKVSVALDSHLLSELNRLKAIKKWIRPDAYRVLRHWKPVIGLSDRHVMLLSDPQLSTPAAQVIVSGYLQEDHAILFSGSLDQKSYAKSLVTQHRASCHILPVHNSDAEYEMIKRANQFALSIPVHTARKAYTDEISL